MQLSGSFNIPVKNFITVQYVYLYKLHVYNAKTI